MERQKDREASGQETARRSAYWILMDPLGRGVGLVIRSPRWLLPLHGHQVQVELSGAGFGVTFASRWKDYPGTDAPDWRSSASPKEFADIFGTSQSDGAQTHTLQLSRYYTIGCSRFLPLICGQKPKRGGDQGTDEGPTARTRSHEAQERESETPGR